MKNIKLLTAAGVMTALMAVFANLSIPFAGLVLTLGVFGVLLTGLMLPPKYAVLSIIAYIMLGVAGVPVFAGFSAGAGALFGPTGGFLFAYPVMAVFASIGCINGITKASAPRILIGLIAALTVCYIFGGGWYSLWANVNISEALALTVLPFIPFDIAKAVLAVITAKAAAKIIPY
ncbi:MAG: biotin transporter BioY [Ruminococcus sp.]|jgi:biotin transport system substrate-specific component|nr:biotin transporter BioY [Ruminococcus sp.]